MRVSRGEGPFPTAKPICARRLRGHASILGLSRPSAPLMIVELRRRRLRQVCIARSLGVSKSTVSRVLAHAGPSRWRDICSVGTEYSLRASLSRRRDLSRYQEAGALRAYEAPPHWVRRRSRLDVPARCVDDNARIAFMLMKPDECWRGAAAFLGATAAYLPVSSLPSSMAACTTQLAMVCALQPNLRDNCSAVLPTRASSIIRWRISA